MSFNLRVGKNDPLRARLLSGSLLPKDLVSVSWHHRRPLGYIRRRGEFGGLCRVKSDLTSQ